MVGHDVTRQEQSRKVQGPRDDRDLREVTITFGPSTTLVRNSANRLCASLGSVHSSRSTSQLCTRCGTISARLDSHSWPRMEPAQAVRPCKWSRWVDRDSASLSDDERKCPPQRGVGENVPKKSVHGRHFTWPGDKLTGMLRLGCRGHIGGLCGTDTICGCSLTCPPSFNITHARHGLTWYEVGDRGRGSARLSEVDVQADFLLRVLQHLLDRGDGLHAALRRLGQHLAVDGGRRAQVVRVLGYECLERLPATILAMPVSFPR